GGDTWERSDRGLPSRFGFAVHVARPGTVYTVPLESETERHVKAGALRVFASTDGGGTWSSRSDGLPERHYYAGVLRDGLESDELEPHGLYLGTTSGELFASSDAGAHWTRLPESF